MLVREAEAEALVRVEGEPDVEGGAVRYRLLERDGAREDVELAQLGGRGRAEVVVLLEVGEAVAELLEAGEVLHLGELGDAADVRDAGAERELLGVSGKLRGATVVEAKFPRTPRATCPSRDG
ncbi:hypothetical protein WMF37_47230 [Sorangium sp. So ce291]|uniref:hypothetical protein n=1 Tax=Sorangium sp. So ce291 TaxID=3133294 RepID=UPI003F63ADCF